MSRSKPHEGPGERVRQKTPPTPWAYRGAIDGRLSFKRVLAGETRLRAVVTCTRGGQAHVHEITIRHPTSDAARSVASLELEEEITRAIDELCTLGWSAILTACGIDRRAAVKGNRGPNVTWTRQERAELVRRVLERQAAGEKPTAGLDYAENRVRELMRDAERDGQVVIERAPGKPNRYVAGASLPETPRVP